MSFKKDLALGQKGEKLVKKVLEKFGLKVEVSDDRKTDLKCEYGKKKFSIEIKHDFYAEKSRNIALEYFNSSKNEPSGIASTKSKLWVQIIPDFGYNTMWMASVKILKKFIKDNKPWKALENIGDGNAHIYLYRIDDILDKIFHRIDNMSEENFKKILKELLK